LRHTRAPIRRGRGRQSKRVVPRLTKAAGNAGGRMIRGGASHKSRTSLQFVKFVSRLACIKCGRRGISSTPSLAALLCAA
jgi:hypothetical protein